MGQKETPEGLQVLDGVGLLFLFAIGFWGTRFFTHSHMFGYFSLHAGPADFGLCHSLGREAFPQLPQLDEVGAGGGDTLDAQNNDHRETKDLTGQSVLLPC